MKNGIVAFRPNEKSWAKIQELKDEGMIYSEILEEAVDYYYAMKKNQLTDDPMYHLLRVVVNEALERWASDLKALLISERYDMQYVLAYLDMCLKGFGFASDEVRALNLIHEKSHFKEELDRQIAVMAALKLNDEEKA